ncbi:MAG: MerC domain-containing protein [Saprospiraceae bacterium]
MKILSKINADMAGFFTAMLCAIHCSSIPVLISLGMLNTSTWLHNHAIDWFVIITGIIIAGYSLIGDYLKLHRQSRPLIIAGIGFTFLIVGMVEHHGWILIFSVLGGLMVAWAHMVNISLSKTCALKSL